MVRALNIKNLHRKLAGSSGLTLVEVLFAVGIITVAVTVVGEGIFQVTSVQRFWADDKLATRDLRHAGNIIAEDALNAEDAFDSGGVVRLTCEPDPPASEVILSWSDVEGTAHTVNYQVSQNSLLRIADGFQQTLTSRVVEDSVSFSLCGSLLTLEMEVEARQNETQAMCLRTYIRKMQ